jgi:hypothetical protein
MSNTSESEDDDISEEEEEETFHCNLFFEELENDEINEIEKRI